MTGLLLFRINEESFWQNYFYRVNLICNASNLESLESTDYNTASSNVNSNLTGNNMYYFIRIKNSISVMIYLKLNIFSHT